VSELVLSVVEGAELLRTASTHRKCACRFVRSVVYLTQTKKPRGLREARGDDRGEVGAHGNGILPRQPVRRQVPVRRAAFIPLT